ncbi:N-acetylmuramoyl-L-alanine amidase [Asanoa sp. WMMD1127]|uniref:peptidoglycan recognition protein family protein n=1 Tax=Asanoa sp. WMMD1127 TaxID=3016107 RepID=UPI0024164748|nr:N-acetylmuramoyl-L-alanine amidase [Asanoa sp. WMMD1127]MDG4826014.1 N-acetylmuramoyl-L-alanine amidase [Asanoa sp. WMMD1127]
MPKFDGVAYDGPPRGYGNSGAKKLYIAIHNTSNDAPPKNEASYAKRRTDSVSSHFYADASTVIQSLDTNYDAWHAGSSWGNQRAIAFELVGTNGSSEAYWRKVIDRVAPVIAKVCKAHGIPVQNLSVAQAKAKNVGGFVTHDDMRQAWGGTTHTDPGPNFPESYLIERVKAAMGTPTPPAPPKPPAAPKPPTTPKPPATPTDWTVSLIMALATLKRGSKGQLVRNAQALLNSHGYRITIDGDFGPATDTATKAFQRARKLSADGEIGRNTWTALITK